MPKQPEVDEALTAIPCDELLEAVAEGRVVLAAQKHKAPEGFVLVSCTDAPQFHLAVKYFGNLGVTMFRSTSPEGVKGMSWKCFLIREDEAAEKGESLAKIRRELNAASTMLHRRVIDLARDFARGV